MMFLLCKFAWFFWGFFDRALCSASEKKSKEKHLWVQAGTRDALQTALFPTDTSLVVCLDVFEPESISAHSTRGPMQWAVLFKCLCVRPVDIELIESLDNPDLKMHTEGLW